MNRTATILLVACAVALPPASAAAGVQRCPKAVEECVAEKAKSYENRGVVGFLWTPLVAGESAPGGARFVVRGVPPGYPAAVAGIRVGDALLAIDDKDLTKVSREEFEASSEAIRAGDTVVFLLLRDGKEVLAKVTATKAEPASVQAWIGRHVEAHHSPEDYRRYLRELKEKRTAPKER